MVTTCVVILLALLPQTPAVPADASSILTRAVAWAGGRDALAAARVLEWTGRATVHAPNRRIALEGEWMIEPPAKASVLTWEAEKGRASARRMSVDGNTGTIERDGKSSPMPPEMLASERDQFYLYAVLKLTSLHDRDVALTAIGRDGLEVRRPGRPAVKVHFSPEGRPLRMETTVVDPASRTEVAEELEFEDVVTAGGIRWPKRIRISQGGRVFFELEIVEFRVR